MDILNTTHLPQLSTTLIAISTLLGAYLLIIRIRQATAENPDPKLTYATIKQLDNITNKLNTHENNTQNQIHNLRLEVKNDYQIHDRSIHRASENLHSLLRKTIQETAALQAQSQITQARIAELTIKTDKLLTKI